MWEILLHLTCMAHNTGRVSQKAFLCLVQSKKMRLMDVPSLLDNLAG
jgi:hypothetical protein